MTDPLALIWPSVDTPEPHFTLDEVTSWPAGARERLEATGILKQTKSATHVVCPGCDEGHVEEVVHRRDHDGTVRHYVRCPEALRVEVPAQLLLQWTIDFDALAGAIAGGMKLKGRVGALVPGRLWRLGRTPWPEAHRDVLFARGLAWPDAGQVASRTGPGGRAIVLVADRAPPPDVWPGQEPAVVLLVDMVHLVDGRAELDLAEMTVLVSDHDQALEAAGDITLDGRRRRSVLRRQVKSELKSMLADDAIAKAYLVHGSYRKTAAALTAECGAPVTKDQVFNAIKRLGGPKKIGMTSDSESICRAVASHRRDKPRRSFPSP
ncbi:MAG: hypothetical protein ISS78_02185 [Phycisphaerae bacterium]|nr:hypothetical protein [Phycisphaerae bacterium]